MTSTHQADSILLDAAQSVVEMAKRQSATVAEATATSGSHLSAKVRQQKTELIEEAGSFALGLRVMIGQRVGVSYTSDLSADGRERLVNDAIELAKLSEPDPFAGAVDPELLSHESQWASVDSFDASASLIDARKAVQMALEGEAAAIDADSRITNSEGATVSRADGQSVLVTSGGFIGWDRGSYVSLVVNPVADDADGKKRSGYYWTGARHVSDLESSASVGKEAARRTLAQLGAKKIPTTEMPIIFDRDIGRSVIGLFAGCILGSSIWRKSSYLVDRVGTEVASPLISLVDDPTIPRAPGSRRFDGEGVLSRVNSVVEDGRLKMYLTDSYSGRKLGISTTANAGRSSSATVSPTTTNFVLRPGEIERNALIESTPRGLFVTNTMGFGFNAVTGDFSRGASGFLIENGRLTQPVAEVTISLNLDQILKRIDAIANDPDHRSSTVCPTFRVRSMTVAGG
ncbi:MAG: TldD/PmbA family protein [Polyangiales bacterium]